MPKMFEIGVLCIVVLAVGYWVTLWLMGRHDDVLHGHFVHAEGEGEAAVEAAISPLPARPPFPPKPVLKPSAVKPAVLEPVAAKPAVLKPVAATAAPAAPAEAAPAPTPVLNAPSDTLQSLLVSIKRDLKNAAQL
jgi:hypothetical protein